MELRPYQHDAVKAIMQGWEGEYQRELLVLPTGTGKTIVFCTVAQQRARKGRVLILAHREELIEQARDKYHAVTGGYTAKEKADETCIGSDLPVVVGSVQTLQSERRLSRFDPDYFSTIIIDEAHHALADSYQRILGHFPDARVLGVTATPDRGDKRNLAEYFDGIAYEYSLRQAIKDKYLCPLTAYTAPLRIDVSDVKTGFGAFGNDYDSTQLGETLEAYLPQIAQSIQENAGDRKTVVFLPLVSIAQQFRDICLAYGLDAREVNGQSVDRSETLDWFDKAGAGSVLCNAMLLTEGWDCPSLDCVVVLRPTQSRALYAQMIGRGTRLSKGKKNLLILDFLWMTGRHDLCKPACLVSDDEDVQQRISAKTQDEEIELLDAEERAEQDINDEVEERRRTTLARAIEEAKRHPKKIIDPLEFFDLYMGGEKFSYEPTFKWEYLPITDKQAAYLSKQGINTDGMTRGAACSLISRFIKRIEQHLATPKQIKTLEKYGYDGVRDWSFDEASSKIDELARYRWNPALLRIPPIVYSRQRRGLTNE